MALTNADRWFFDIWSRGYDMAIPQRLAYRPVHDAVQGALPPRVGAQRVLDVGCGTGELLQRLTVRYPGVHAVGCDFSTGMLRQATAKNLDARWVQGDACRLPFRDAAFDVITSTEAFHWFPDQDGALREFYRVLVPGGHLLLALVMPPLALVSAVAHVGSRLVGEPFHWPTRAEIRARLARAGFEVEDQRRIFRFPGLLMLPALTIAVRPPLRVARRMPPARGPRARSRDVRRRTR